MDPFEDERALRRELRRLEHREAPELGSAFTDEVMRRVETRATSDAAAWPGVSSFGSLVVVAAATGVAAALATAGVGVGHGSAAGNERPDGGVPAFSADLCFPVLGPPPTQR